MWNEQGYWVETNDRPKNKRVVCDCCRFITKCKAYRFDEETAGTNRARAEKTPPYRYLCGLCANTSVSTLIDYPQHHDHDALETMQMINYVGNAILAEIRKGKKQ